MKYDEPRPLIEHVLEFRSVLLSCFCYIALGMVVSMFFSDYIFDFLINPLSVIKGVNNVVYTSITEPASTELRVSFYSAVLISFPLILNKIWGFIKIGLEIEEITVIKKYGYISISLFLIGIVFAYYIAIPTIIKGLSNWSFGQSAKFLPKMSENITFVLILMFSFGLSFQIPVIMIALDKLKIFPIEKQKNYWREYIMVVTVFSAIFTPPDALSMLFLTCPLLILYIFIILIYKNPLIK